MARLRGVQRALCCRRSSYLRQIEDDLLIELERILDQEKILWRQKSCSNWISLGDRNTTYFHRKATIRKQRNKISSLKVYNDDWCDNGSILKFEAVKFYCALFSIDLHPQGKFPVMGCFPTVSPALMHSLEAISNDEEIQAALLDMAPLKAPDIFPASVIPHFFNIRCPQPGDVADTCCWRWDQQFSVGSAYAKLMANRWNIPHPFWKKVWSLAVL
ncbi:hypothetical protein V6N13_143050 [Hibiscus sabdariffa]